MISNIFNLIALERKRQEDEICLIASENYTSKNVMNAQGSILTNKYAEGYSGHRYYGGCEVVDKIEQYAIDKCKQLFNCKYANVQPHSGSQANQAVYLALCKPGDTILGMDLNAGGHLTHGSKVSSSGKLYNSISYGLNENGIINYDEIKEKLYKYNPRVLVVGASAYSRIIDFERIKSIVEDYNHELEMNACNYTVEFYDRTYDRFLKFKEEVRKFNPDKVEFYENAFSKCKCYLMVDMAHIAGLVATGLHLSPIPYADVVTSTTHKTLRGPRGGIILTNDEELAKRIDKAVFPGNQGGPLEHIIAGKAICFEEALTPEFKEYIKQVKINIQVMTEVFKKNNIKMISNGSDNHLILIDLKEEKFSGKDLETALEKIGIITNKNAVQNDPKPKTETSGLRIGTACITTRGAKEQDAKLIAEVIAEVIDFLRNYQAIPDAKFDSLKRLVKDWCSNHPIYPEEEKI